LQTTAPAALALIDERNIFAVYTHTLRAGETRAMFPAPEFEGDYQIGCRRDSRRAAIWPTDEAAVWAR
jgi:hypothetical protein